MAFEDGSTDPYIFDRPPPAPFQPALDRLDIGRPVAFSHRLHHLHAGAGVILPLGVALILQDYVRARSQPVTGVMRLLDRDGQPAIAYRAAGHRLFGPSAPPEAEDRTSVV